MAAQPANTPPVTIYSVTFTQNFCCVGGFMKTRRTVVRTILSVVAVCALGVCSQRAMAQTSNSVSAGQTPKAIPARITQAIDETQLFTAKGSLHPLAQPQLDQGAVPDATPLKHIQLMLSRSDDQQRELSQLMADQMTKGSPNFHAWVTPQDFGARFGPADADIKVVTDWLASQGFSDITISPGKILIDFSGNVGQVRNAFHTGIHQFMVNGELHQANVSDVQFPAALSPVVRGIVSLNDFRVKSHRKVSNAITQFRPDDTGVNNSSFAVGPADFAKIYNVPSTLDGTGGKIAIIGFSNISPADVVAFRTLFGLTPTNNVNVVLNGEDPGIVPDNVGGEEGEAVLDVEASGAVAQKAQIDFIVSEPTLTSDPIFLGIEYVVFNNSDDIMSLSFGSCEPQTSTAALNFINAVFEEAAAQGISVTVSAGDNGAAGCDNFITQTVAVGGLAVNALASTPFNVAVGGTDFDDANVQVSSGSWSSTNGTGLESANGYIHEIPWNDSCASAATSSNLNTVCAAPPDFTGNIVAGSGGVSVVVPAPSYQTGIVPNGITPGAKIGGVTVSGNRFLPDVSLFASDGGENQDLTKDSLSSYVECQADDILPDGNPASCVPDSTGTVHFQPVGGTSASAPSFAGILALIGQSESNAGRSRRLGNANITLYNLAAANAGANVCDSSQTGLNGSQGSKTCLFYDITKTQQGAVANNAVPCGGGAALNCSATTNGVLVSPGSATPPPPAYTTTAGTGTALTSFDLATGLGSVNVTNLAAQWHNAGLIATTTTTTVNGIASGNTTPIPLNHATGVTLQASVTPATATGDVGFVASPALPNGGIDFLKLTNGTASSGSTKIIIPGGTYTIMARYGGDQKFAQSIDATGVQVTVAPENSGVLSELVTFDAAGNITATNATSFAIGSSYILRVDIENSTGSATTCVPLSNSNPPPVSGCAFDATGTVTLTDNGTPLNQSPYHVNSEGHFEDNQIDLVAGSHTVVASYSGDNSYNSSTATLNLTVTKATSAISASAPATATTGSQVTLSATVSSPSNSATGLTGTVTFSNNGTQIGSPVPVTAVPASATAGDGATATMTTTFTTTGTESITATYSGDANYAASGPSTAVSIQVSSSGSFSVTVPSTAQMLPSGSTLMVPISVTSSGGFAGSVTVNCTNLAPGVSCNNGQAFAINVTAANTTGNPAVGQLPVALAATSTNLTAMALPESNDLRHSLARIGLVTAGIGSGFAALFFLLIPGRKRLRAALGLSLVCVLSLALGCGGGGGGGTVTPANTTTQIALTPPAKNSTGNFAFAAMVSGGSTTPTGSVQFKDGANTLGGAVTLSGGSAMFTENGLTPAGTHAISASYSGDSGHMTSSSGGINVTVTGNNTITINVPGASNGANQNLSITVQ